MKRLLDLFCGAGGASMGYHRAGFEVVGVDIKPQPHYPFIFVQADAIDFVRRHGKHFDAIHASPPCQAYTIGQRLQGNRHALSIADVRVELRKTGKPYIIENVEGAPLKREAIMLCGSFFGGLRVYRHRLFESNLPIIAPTLACNHTAPIAKMGRPVKANEFIHVVGNFSDVKLARKAMGIPWMTRNELSEAIPPAYTEYIGYQLFGDIVKNSNEIKPPLDLDSMDEAQLRDEVRTLSRALTKVNQTRDERGSLEDGWMVGGADVCATCSAHCNVMDDDQREIERLTGIICGEFCGSKHHEVCPRSKQNV